MIFVWRGDNFSECCAFLSLLVQHAVCQCKLTSQKFSLSTRVGSIVSTISSLLAAVNGAHGNSFCSSALARDENGANGVDTVPSREFNMSVSLRFARMCATHAAQSDCSDGIPICVADSRTAHNRCMMTCFSLSVRYTSFAVSCDNEQDAVGSHELLVCSATGGWSTC